jgi:hypothetical protein
MIITWALTITADSWLCTPISLLPASWEPCKSSHRPSSRPQSIHEFFGEDQLRAPMLSTPAFVGLRVALGQLKLGPVGRAWYLVVRER